MSRLEELTSEELIGLVRELHRTIRVQQGQIEQISELRATIERQAERIAQLEEEVARLGGPRSKPDWVKANKPKKEGKRRKKRVQSFSRQSLPPNRVCYHAVDVCPDCGRKLRGGSVKWRRQVIEIPPTPVEVTDHVFVERRCGVCGKRYVPDKTDVLAGVVVGKRSVGIGLMSLIAHLKTACRVPIGLIRRFLESVYGLRISNGEIAEILHAVAEIGNPEYEDLLERVRGSPVVHGDETGWREDGVNGYIWSFSTPGVRYFTYNQSRSSAVVTEVLGEEFAGALVSDFYAAYNIYEGVKQRCWVHFKRSLDALAENHADNAAVVEWASSVLAVYYRAKAAAQGDYSDLERCRLRASFESELELLAEPYLRSKAAPQHTLAQRIDRFAGELFTFVQWPYVPSENNAAERAIRPAVVARKVSGGTRSPRGSKTATVLRSLFETWSLQGLNTLDACRQMIISRSQSPSPTSA